VIFFRFQAGFVEEGQSLVFVRHGFCLGPPRRGPVSYAVSRCLLFRVFGFRDPACLSAPGLDSLVAFLLRSYEAVSWFPFLGLVEQLLERGLERRSPLLLPGRAGRGALPRGLVLEGQKQLPLLVAAVSNGQ